MQRNMFILTEGEYNELISSKEKFQSGYRCTTIYFLSVYFKMEKKENKLTSDEIEKLQWLIDKERIVISVPFGDLYKNIFHIQIIINDHTTNKGLYFSYRLKVDGSTYMGLEIKSVIELKQFLSVFNLLHANSGNPEYDFCVTPNK